MQRIVLNYAFAPKRPTGLGVYAKEIMPSFDIFEGVLAAPADITTQNASLRRIVTQENLRSDRGSAAQLRRLAWTEQHLPNLRVDRRDLVFSPHPESPLFSCRKAVVVHDLIPLVTHGHSWRLRGFFKYYVLPLIKRCELIITISEATREDLRSFAGISEDRMRVIPNGVDYSKFSPRKPIRKQPFFLYVGRHDKYKNIESCIRGFAAVADRECRLKIVGPENPHETPRLKRLAGELGVESRVDFLSYLSFDELVITLQTATALVHLSSYEGFGLTILEAMAANTSVICSNAPAILEVAKDFALSCDPENIHAVAEAMERVLGDAAYRTSLELSGQERAREYSWDQTRHRLRQELLKLL